MKKSEVEAQKKILKDQAVNHFSKGKFDKALESYLQLWKLAPEDLRVRLKIGEILHKLGRKKEAIAVYKKVSEAYGLGGFLIQAISVCKIILELDPEELETKNLLAGLYSKRGMDKESRMASGVPDHGVEARNGEVDAEALLDELFSEDVALGAGNLPAIPLFSELNKEELIALIDTLTPWKVPEGTVICQEGTPAESMFIIANGTIQVCTQDKKGSTLNLARLNPGDFFGEIGLFTRQSRTASCVAVEEVELLEIKRTDFNVIVKRFPRVKEALHNFYKTRILDTILVRSELFGALKAEVRQDLAKRFKAIECQQGQFIVEEGQQGDCLFVIRDGAVEVVTKKDGQEVMLATLQAGDFFGEVALISGKKRTASIRAKDESVVMRLGKEDFNWALQVCPEMLEIAKHYVEKRVQETIKKMI